MPIGLSPLRYFRPFSPQAATMKMFSSVTGSCSGGIFWGEIWDDSQIGLGRWGETCASAYLMRLSAAMTAMTGALFCMGYGLVRFIVEYFREPDSYLGLGLFGLSRGQWLSLPVIALGVVVWIWVNRRRPREIKA